MAEQGAGNLGFAVLGISHVGLAPSNLEQATSFFSSLLALPALGDEIVAAQQTATFMFGSQHSSDSSVFSDSDMPRLELLAPAPEGQGPIAQFLAKKGSGIHHLALKVSGIEAAIAHLIANHVTMIDATPRPGAHHTRIAFVHPRSTGGLLVELVEESTKHENQT
jgi:methylmalonyl-CoA/ethylmalonyl-CoA epimerase